MLELREGQNVSLGQAGSIFRNTTTATTYNAVAIQFLDDTTFTTLTPESAEFIGTSDGSGDDIPNTQVFIAGTVIYGRWTAFELLTGSIIAYRG